MGRCWVGRGYLWSFTEFSADPVLFSAFITDCNASITSAASDAGFGDIANTEKDLDIIQKKKKEKKRRKKENTTTNKKKLDDL